MDKWCAQANSDADALHRSVCGLRHLHGQPVWAVSPCDNHANVVLILMQSGDPAKRAKAIVQAVRGK